MTKIVYNGCYGGFGLSDAAIDRYAEIKGITVYERKYLVPAEEFEAIRAEEIQSQVGPGRYATNLDLLKSNALYFSASSIARTDPALVQVVEELGEKASGDFAQLLIAEVPAGTKYRIDEYDGYESVMTIDDYDWEIA